MGPTILLLLSFCFAGCANQGGSNEPSKEEPHKHVFVDHPAKAATCTEEGNIAYASCSVCGKTFNITHLKEISNYTIAKKPHTFVDHDSHSATCINTGNIAYSTCSVCGKIFSSDHQQELEEGSYIIDKTAHQYIDRPAKEPTCTENGYIAHSTCAMCGKIFTADHSEEITDTSYLIAKLPHDLTHHEPVVFETVEYWECGTCHHKFLDEEATTEVTDVNDNGYHDILNQNVKNYLSATTDEEILTALGENNPHNNQVRKALSWRDSGHAPYTIEVAKDEGFTSYKTYESLENHILLPGTLIPGMKYYYRVKDSTNNLIVKIGGIDVDGTYPVRTLYVEGVSNVRDAGGWTAKDGNKVLYDKIIRGGRLSGITDEGKEVLLGDLGVKTEIDLRAGSGGFQDIDDSRLTYHQLGINQYTTIVPDYLAPKLEDRDARYGFDSTNPLPIKGIFEVLADENSYPVYYHCNAGADRTGTITYLINGLLGVSYEDLTKDFELTTFSSQGNRFRSQVENGHFVTEGERAGIYQCNSDNYVAWGKLHELISTKYAQSNGQLCSAIEYYLKKVCDVSDETIAAVRKNLLGKDVEFDPVVLEVDKTFTMENGNWTKNSQISYEKGTFFGSECYKFYTTDTTQDHYIYNNLSMILNDKYTNFHFEVYVPSTAPKWDAVHNSGCRFHMSVKETQQSLTNNMQFGDNITILVPNKNYPLTVDEWNSYDLDISTYTQLVRFAFYMAYGAADNPAVMYLRNVYVS